LAGKGEKIKGAVAFFFSGSKNMLFKTPPCCLQLCSFAVRQSASKKVGHAWQPV